MVKKIEKKIVSFKIGSDESVEEKIANSTQTTESNIIQMHEKVSRPEALSGSTYKIKTHLSDHALYLTINDIVLNEGTDHELRRPFEIFINEPLPENPCILKEDIQIASPLLSFIFFKLTSIYKLFTPKNLRRKIDYKLIVHFSYNTLR